MTPTLPQAFKKNFLGNSPGWYETAIIAFLILNPIALYLFGPFITGWMLIGEFIFTLAMALKCYPLQPGGLLAIEAIALGLLHFHIQNIPNQYFCETILRIYLHLSK